jgi:hypothetical protein
VTPEQIRLGFLRGFLLGCICVSATGCSHQTQPGYATVSQGNENAPYAPAQTPQEASLQLQTEQKLAPLTADDVQLYLRVMRGAAQRVQVPTAQDLAILSRAGEILQSSSSGKLPTMQDVQTLERANLVALHMDQVVAKETGVDAHEYRGVAEAIEFALFDPPAAATTKAPPIPPHSSPLLEARLGEVYAANRKFLQPYTSEIQRLVKIVREPSRLPK